jgi:hypothetical protein
MPTPRATPVLTGQPAPTGERLVPADAKALVVIVHPDAASRRASGHRFVTDVLRANGLASLSLSLRTPREEAEGGPLPPPQELARRLAQALLALAPPHQRTQQGPPASVLFGVGDAVPACVLAMQRPVLKSLRAMVLLDGPADAEPPARWPVPTLLIAGRDDGMAPTERRHRIQAVAPPHRLALLVAATRPAEAGAYEAVACEVAAWMLQPQPQPAHRPGRPRTRLAMVLPAPAPVAARPPLAAA